ncbi:MAG: hypothetical protein DMG77_03755 [Acidobacteria bacterium]|nr:MAG: hypothetical protein DMG77_03755 [Acidobacteriota bacterium]
MFTKHATFSWFAQIKPQSPIGFRAKPESQFDASLWCLLQIGRLAMLLPNGDSSTTVWFWALTEPSCLSGLLKHAAQFSIEPKKY